MILYCATTNRGKLREFRASGLPIEPLPNLGDISVPDETGETFEENAIQKALYYGAFTAEYLIAEDSGIAVEALGGAPGIYSARFAGPGATDESNNLLLLEKLRGVENRKARYVCAIALVASGQALVTFRGEVEGWIVDESCGSNGFGYDPLFFYPPFNRTFGEVDPELKRRVSHRAVALAKLAKWLA